METTPRRSPAAIRQQIAAVADLPTNGSWRRRVAKAKQLTRLRDAEARARRRGPSPDLPGYEDPF